MKSLDFQIIVRTISTTQTPSGGDIFVEFGGLQWRTHSVGEIFFNKSF